MKNLKEKQGDFLRLLLLTSVPQGKAMLKTIQKSQLQAMVQIVYNVLMGNRDLPEKDKNRLKKHRTIIRRFVSKRLSQRERKQILVKYSEQILTLLRVVKEELA